MEQIVEFASSISTPIGIVALIIVCCLFAYRVYLRGVERTLDSDVEDETKVRALNKLHIPTDRLSKQEQFDLAKSKLNGQFGVLRISILITGALALVAMLLATTAKADECSEGINEARDLVRQQSFEPALERLNALYQDCEAYRFSVASVASEVTYRLGRNEQTVTWLERAIAEIGDGTTARDRWGAAYSSLGYAYERVNLYEQSLHAHAQARREIAPDSAAYARSLTASGYMRYLLWLDDPSETLRTEILSDFETAASLAGNLGLSPQLGLACMHAHMQNADQFELQMRSIVGTFEQFPNADNRVSGFLNFTQDYLLAETPPVEQASYPRRCEPLASFFRQCRCFDELSNRLATAHIPE